MKTRRRRRGPGKRTDFKRVPKMPVPVRAVWDSASGEEREKAHGTSAAILQYWLGKRSKQETAEALGVKPLRVWQLSQQALSGMVAGLLKQPRKRRSAMVTPPEDDPRALKKRIAELERELEIAQDVIELLRDLPANREAKPPTAAGKKKKRPRRTKKAPPRRAPGDRGMAPDGTDPTT